MDNSEELLEDVGLVCLKWCEVWTREIKRLVLGKETWNVSANYESDAETLKEIGCL
jgi:hypothetical protein